MWKCEYRCSVHEAEPKPEEMVTSYIVRNGVRAGYERLQTTRPDVVELAQTEAAATEPARDTSGGARRPSGSSHSVSDVLAAVEAERHCVHNKVSQISSYKDAMECVGDVVQIVELLYGFLQQLADLEEGGPPGFRESRATLTLTPTPSLPPRTPAAAAMAGRRSPCLCLCLLSYFSFRFWPKCAPNLTGAPLFALCGALATARHRRLWLAGR